VKPGDLLAVPDVHGDSTDCPTYYDGCHCTVEVLKHNIERAEKAEAEVARLQAEAAVMREALIRCREQLHDQQAMPDDSQDEVYEAALTTDAGRALLVEVKALRKIAEVARDAASNGRATSGLMDALDALDTKGDAP
jgi:hypothetical protein